MFYDRQCLLKEIKIHFYWREIKNARRTKIAGSCIATVYFPISYFIFLIKNKYNFTGRQRAEASFFICSDTYLFCAWLFNLI